MVGCRCPIGDELEHRDKTFFSGWDGANGRLRQGELGELAGGIGYTDVARAVSRVGKLGGTRVPMATELHQRESRIVKSEEVPPAF